MDGRKARAQATRARIVEAATSLFIADGYGATSINAIAAQAGVGEQTVYYSFGTKHAILSAVLDRAIAGDDEPVPTLEREWTRAAIEDPSAAGQLRAQVMAAGEILRRVGRLLEVVRGGTASDADLAVLWATNLEQRLAVQQEFARALAGKVQLTSVEEAADVMLLLLSADSYCLLVHARGWSHEQWCEWTLDTLIQRLL